MAMVMRVKQLGEDVYRWRAPWFKSAAHCIEHTLSVEYRLSGKLPQDIDNNILTLAVLNDKTVYVYTEETRLVDQYNSTGIGVIALYREQEDDDKYWLIMIRDNNGEYVTNFSVYSQLTKTLAQLAITTLPS
jgi:hypothetical protein